MKILDGKKLSEKILQELKKEVNRKRLRLTLGVNLVGDDKVSESFISQKKKACEKIGINFRLFKFPSTINPSGLKKEIGKIAKKKNFGIIIQLPLPKKFIPGEFLRLIPERKDIDVLSEESLGKFFQGTLPIRPPTVAGILAILKEYKINTRGKNIIIIGAGKLVGFPLAVQLLKEKATLSVLEKFTKDTPFFLEKADIIISGVGKPNLVKGSMVKKGVIVVDAGSSWKAGKVIGDVDFKTVSKKASYISPVPGGVGPLTVAFLLKNLIKINS